MFRDTSITSTQQLSLVCGRQYEAGERLGCRRQAVRRSLHVHSPYSQRLWPSQQELPGRCGLHGARKRTL